MQVSLDLAVFTFFVLILTSFAKLNADNKAKINFASVGSY